MDIKSLDSSVSSIIPKVEFLNVQDQYCYDEDLVCEYSLVDHIPREHDRVAIYRVGWTNVQDYMLFEWAPLKAEGNVASVTFNRPSLPKNSTGTIFHFCYISADNQVLGASPPFDFTAEVPKTHCSLSCIKPFSAPVMNSSGYSMKTVDSMTSTAEKDKEIARLKDENALLKETLKMIVYSKKESNVEKDVEELKSTVLFLKRALHIQENEINSLKQRLSEKEGSVTSNKISDKFRTVNEVIDLGDLETLPPFPY